MNRPVLASRNVYPEQLPDRYHKGDKPGMNLRQHYAGLALQGLIARWGDEYTPEGHAALAVAHADALLLELTK
jgi:hypothetical protein